MSDLDLNELFNDSYEYVISHDEDFFPAFYNEFINKSQTVKDAFAGVDLDRQVGMLRDAIAYMVGFFITKIANQYLLEISRQHARALQIEPDLYTVFVDSLIDTLKEHYPRYRPACGLAWRITLAPGIELMKHASEIPIED